MSKPQWRLMAGAVAIAGVIAGSTGLVFQQHHTRPSVTQDSTTALAASSKSSTQSTTISYNGEDGQTALTLLRRRAVTETRGSGPGQYVVSINGQRANDLKHEYWALYVNERLCDTNAAEYLTHNDDKLEWKLAAY